MNTVQIATHAPEKATGPSAWQDSIGIVASVGCAIHCAAMPFVIAYLPALGLSFLADEAFHQWMALFCFLIAIAAFVPGIRKHENMETGFRFPLLPLGWSSSPLLHSGWQVNAVLPAATLPSLKSLTPLLQMLRVPTAITVNHWWLKDRKAPLKWLAIQNLTRI